MASNKECHLELEFRFIDHSGYPVQFADIGTFLKNKYDYITRTYNVCDCPCMNVAVPLDKQLEFTESIHEIIHEIIHDIDVFKIKFGVRSFSYA